MCLAASHLKAFLALGLTVGYYFDLCGRMNSVNGNWMNSGFKFWKTYEH